MKNLITCALIASVMGAVALPAVAHTTPVYQPPVVTDDGMLAGVHYDWIMVEGNDYWQRSFYSRAQATSVMLEIAAAKVKNPRVSASNWLDYVDSASVNGGITGNFQDSTPNPTISLTVSKSLTADKSISGTLSGSKDGAGLNVGFYDTNVDKYGNQFNVGASVNVDESGTTVGPNFEVVGGKSGKGLNLSLVDIKLVEVEGGNNVRYSINPIAIAFAELFGAKSALDVLGIHLPLGLFAAIVDAASTK